MTEAPTTGGRGRALIIQHEQPTPPGLVQNWLEERGFDVDILRIDERDPHDIDPSDYGLIVSLGSEFGAYQDDLEWIGHEMDFLKKATDEDVPILGVCFGGQLLARVLGGEVFRSDKEEIGWFPVGTTDPELVPDGPWFQWHFDSFTAPPGAEVIAENEVGPQAYVIGRNLGVQFHPEVTPEIMDAWVKAYKHELDEHGIDPDELLRETDEAARKTSETSIKLFDRFLERIAGVKEQA